MENSPSVLFDALVLPDGGDGVNALAADAHTREFVMNQYRHCKPILALGASRSLLTDAGISALDGDAGLLISDRATAKAIDGFAAAIAAHRHRERETDPPRV
jgi:catalase